MRSGPRWWFIYYHISGAFISTLFLLFSQNGCKYFLVDLQKVRQKNQEMKVLMDQMRNLLWDVNAMLTLRK